MTDRSYKTIGDVMTRDVITIARTATVRDAVSLLRANRTSSLVVERRDDTDEYGIVTVKEIADRVLAEDLSPDRVNVYEIMEKPVTMLPADMDIKYGVRLISRYNLTRAIVFDHEREPVGIVTLRDLVLRTITDEAEK